MLIDGLIFGILDNGVLILGAGIGNLVSDAIGAACDPAMQHMVAGVALGCLLPLALIPLVERLRRAKPGKGGEREVFWDDEQEAQS